MDPIRVLVCDDELGMRHGVSRALRDFRLEIEEVDEPVTFTVETAETGEEALEKIDAQPPDILLLDHKLPGMTGLDVLLRLAERPHNILTVMITAYASLETAVTAIKSGAYDFLAKPFTPKELKDGVAKASRSIVQARRVRQLAEEKRQVRFEFIRVLAHELKAPLGAVEGYLRMLQDGAVADNPDAQKHVIDRSLIRLEGMRKLIYDLLDLTRIESGQKQRDLTTVDLRELAELAIETANAAAAERDIRIELHAPASLEMTGDRGEMEIILNNLISNAVKYNRDQGRVDVSLEDLGESVCISVADTGIGMSEADASRLFQDFVRIKNAKTSDILGSGLGLSIVKKLTDLYQGSAEVESQLDIGSTFTVTLAKHSQVAAETSGANTPADATTPGA